MQQQRVIEPTGFGRVGVLMGGVTEREVSLAGGKLVLAALQSRGVDAVPIQCEADIYGALLATPVDRVFNVLHGGDGEGGLAQALFKAMQLPNTDNHFAACALALDKLRSKWVFQGLGLPTPAYYHISPTTAIDVAAIVARLGLPIVVKPSLEGSSVGVSIVRDQADLLASITQARQFGSDILLEQFITGDELTVGIIGEQVLPVIRIEAAEGFYDYAAKYVKKTTRYHLPSGLSPEVEAQVGALALQAFRAVGCDKWGRVDLMRDQTGQCWLLEVNTITGMTATSLVPKAAAVIGLDFADLVMRVLAMSVTEDVAAEPVA